MDKLTIASFNVLNDERVPLYDSQIDRVRELSNCINQVIPKSGRFVIYLCEGATEQNIHKIARKTGLNVMITEKYTDKEYTEWMAFLTDEQTAKDSEVEYILHPEDRDRSGTLVLKNGNTSIVGGHMPHKMNLRDSIERGYIAESMMRRAENDNSIVLGDFNALPIFPSRMKFGFKGFTDAFKENRPIFPSSIGPTSHLPLHVKLIKNLSIDTILHKGSIEQIKAKSIESKASDHPLIFVEFAY